MGDLGTSSDASQTTTNQQVGVQNGVGLGAGAFNFGKISVENSDYRSVQAAVDLGKTALIGNANVSLQAIASANNTSNRALDALQQVGTQFGNIAQSAVSANSQIAGQAAPVSEGNIIQGVTHDAQVTTYVAIAAALLLSLYYISHKH